ncbi:MAG: 2Fe-2S iron-sulfur cluster-binding protein [Vicinamibacteria bacterium]
MRAYGIRSYHRPGRIEEALALAAEGAVPIGGGTRVLASAEPLPIVLDLLALDDGAIEMHELDGGEFDLVIGASATLQEVLDSTLLWQTTCGVLPEACRAQSPSRLLRNLATLAGEVIDGAAGSDVGAVLLALNAVFVVDARRGSLEVPALRFVRAPQDDLAGGGIVRRLVIPGPVQGAALERVSAVPGGPSLLSVAASVVFAGERCARARVAISGIEDRALRIVEAERRLEGSAGEDEAIERVVEEVLRRASFRDDAQAPASYRAAVVPTLLRRALRKAIWRVGIPAEPPEPGLWGAPPRAAPISPLPYFTSGRVELQLNGHARALEVEARTSLLDALRDAGLTGAKRGCQDGECGACAVLLDGRPVPACLVPAVRAHGRSVETIEGLAGQDGLHPVQRAFVEAGAVQCGYCTPAQELVTKALLAAVPRPTEAQVREALAGCPCPCSGGVAPVAAVLEAIATARGRR